MRRLLLVLLGAAILAGSAIVTLWKGPGPASTAVHVTVVPGSSLTGAAQALREKGAIRSVRMFTLMARVTGNGATVQAGEYEIAPRASMATVLAQLQSGKVIQHMITIPEGMPSVLVREKIDDEPLLTGKTPVPEEGSVLPDSYSFERGETRAAVLARMQLAMRETLDAAWKDRKPASVARSKNELLILASIIEKETAVASERRTVAAVYSNRIRIGMRLQADPTTIYPITKGRPLGRRIRRSELDAVNGYNTYAMAGLPIGPIANPGREAIVAAADPAASDALYFVADGKGGHAFARTLSEHQQNVERYYAIRRARGEM